MNTKLFAQYLLERGLIDRDQMLEVIEEQRAVNAGTGDLAVTIGLLTEEDLQAIRAEQLRNDEPFGRTALSLGLLTQKQLDRLKSHQRSSKKMLLSEILVARGYVDPDRLMATEQEFEKEDVVQSGKLEKLLAGAEHGEVVTVALSVLERLYRRVMGDSLRIQDAPTNPPLDGNERLWTQRIHADGASHVMALQMHESSALKISDVVLGAKILRLDALAEDAISEFLNIVVGHVCGRLNQRFDGVQAANTPPRLTCGAELMRDYPDAIVVRCDSGDVRFHFAVGSGLQSTTSACTKRPGRVAAAV